ncbi:hypothetical protein [uncultured Cytophaga sp.]|uniref:hypothetical protein n=1 Tax=uncultured Cytophaga sp. TaxID=160238 RepID=UPI00260DE432|nr:hypothetical protein [uncultured Cytophaga sp.]
MILSLFYSIVFFIQAILTPGANKIDGKHIKTLRARIHKIAQMDSVICESSALVKPDSIFDIYYTLNDSGCKPEVFAINEKGKLLDTKIIPDSRNHDWESMVFYKDSLQHPHLVIGDMGNNTSQRKDLCLYDYNTHTDHTIQHTFIYEDQQRTINNAESKNYDCEAFFIQDSSYYLLSKNWEKGPVKMYQLAQDTAVHTAIVVQKIHMKGMITDCSFHYSTLRKRKELAVLLYGRIFLFEISQKKSAIELIPFGVIKFSTGGQTEGICLYNENELRVCNEKGKLFSVRINNKKIK